MEPLEAEILAGEDGAAQAIWFSSGLEFPGHGLGKYSFTNPNPLPVNDLKPPTRPQGLTG